MATIRLTWDNPSASDITNICVHRFDTDQSATYPNGSISATDAATFAATQTTVLNISDSTYTYSDATGLTFDDTTASLGTTYTYGVFSKNAAGYGPGQASTITI